MAELIIGAVGLVALESTVRLSTDGSKTRGTERIC
jgi:hypothetical protein